MKDLFLEYKKHKSKIKKRLREFKNLQKGNNEDIFAELCFCILTPQSEAIYCDDAIKALKRTGYLIKGLKNQVRSKLNKVRFPNNKTNYIIAARNLFKMNGGFRTTLLEAAPIKTREWLVKNIKGLGYKEASHFLRNIGLGKNLAILDIHILRNLNKYNVIKKIPASISKYTYIDIENKMKKFSKKIKIPIEDLDLLFWAKETGHVFK